MLCVCMGGGGEFSAQTFPFSNLRKRIHVIQYKFNCLKHILFMDFQKNLRSSNRHRFFDYKWRIKTLHIIFLFRIY